MIALRLYDGLAGPPTWQLHMADPTILWPLLPALGVAGGMWTQHDEGIAKVRPGLGNNIFARRRPKGQKSAKPAFRDAVEGKQDEHIYYEALEEHHVIDLVMPQIKSTSRNSDEFPAKAKVLKDLVEHHAEEEESQMFPKARKAMGAAELRELGMRLKERKEELAGGFTGRIQKMLQPKRRAA